MNRTGASSSTRPRFPQLLLAAAIMLAIAWGIWDGLGRPGHTGWIFNVWIYSGAILLAGGACLARARSAPTGGRAWISFGAGLALWATGNIVSYLLASVGPIWGLDVSDFFFLAALPCLFAGIGFIIKARVGSLPLASWFDALALGLAATALVLALLGPTLIYDDGGKDLGAFTNVVYPIGDLLMVGFLVGALVTHGVRGSRSLQLVAAGLLVWATTDTVFLLRISNGSYEAGFFDLLWPVGAILIAAGAVVGVEERPAGREAYRSPKWLAAGSGIAAVSLLCASGLTDVPELSVVAASAAMIALTLRLVVASREYDELLTAATIEAVTDPLTGLPNRRRLFADLAKLARTDERGESLIAVFDLNGFKSYNDAFGHPAGDALLRRLGGNLAAAVAGSGTAYRLGGDEFCILCRIDRRPPAAIVALARNALAERGEAFSITASGGSVELPREESDPDEALRLADSRMYAEKNRGASRFDHQTARALLQVLHEREPALGEHLQSVAETAALTASALRMTAEEVDVVRRAAELHDVGKVAIPDAILHKPGPLNDIEMDLMKSHTLTGERILSASPAMRPVAELVRSSHERWDGGGYPDGLAEAEIPLGSRIILVCDAFDAMTHQRSYQPAIDRAEAIDELRRHAGSQFDPAVVDAFCRVIAEQGSPEWAHEQILGPPELASEPPRPIG